MSSKSTNTTPVLLSSREWHELRGDNVLDDDGWRDGSKLGYLSWDVPITLDEYEERFFVSTVRISRLK